MFKKYSISIDFSIKSRKNILLVIDIEKKSLPEIKMASWDYEILSDFLLIY